MERLIGNSFSMVEEVDVEKNEGSWGDYMRLRVWLDITKLLHQGKKVNVGMGQPCWARFSYERLPNFCYLRGWLSHGMEEYVKGSGNLIEIAINGLPYGQWLRVGPE